MGTLKPGRRTYREPVALCRTGCRVNALRITGNYGELDTAGSVTLHGPGPAAPQAWRVSEGGRLTAAPDGLRIDVQGLAGLPEGVQVEPVDAPYPLPVAVAVAGPAPGPSLTGLDGRPVPIAAGPRLPAIPGLGAHATLLDLEYAHRLTTEPATATPGEVWLAPGAPADIAGRLQAEGLVITADTRADAVRARLDREGPAVALGFYALAALLAVALGAGALALLTWRLTGWALPLAGSNPPDLPLPGRPRAGAVAATAAAVLVALTAMAWWAGHRAARGLSVR